MQYYSYFIVRRVLVAGVAVCLKERVLIQIVCLNLLFFWIAKYQIKYQPFKKKANNVLNTVNEVFLFLFSLMLYSFMSSKNAKRLEM